MDLGKNLSSVRVRSFCAVGCIIWLLCLVYTKYYVEEFTFLKLTPESTDNQWKNIESLFVASKIHNVPLLLFDIDILPNIFVARSKTWKTTLHQCKVLCKHHPEEKNVITFAALAKKFEWSRDAYMKSLVDLGFTVHLSEVPDPRVIRPTKKQNKIPSYLWLARNRHVIHIAFLHERGDDIKYMWVGPVTDLDWIDTAKTLADSIGEGWHSLDAVGAKFPRYAQGYDMSHRFTGLPTYIDSHRVTVPYHINAFLNEYRNSRFIECNHASAIKYIERYDKDMTDRPDHRKNAKDVLVIATKVLNENKVPFWITGSNLLGWFRQCALIPTETEIEIGIWSHDYKEDIMEGFTRENMHLRAKIGRLSEGLELEFHEKDGIRLRLYFFNSENDHVWNLRTRPSVAKKYLFRYQPFVLCWTEHVGIKVQVPCETLTYVESHFGTQWNKPIEEWIWYVSPYNVEATGEWLPGELKKRIQIYGLPKKDKTDDL